MSNEVIENKCTCAGCVFEKGVDIKAFSCVMLVSSQSVSENDARIALKILADNLGEDQFQRLIMETLNAQ